jgi:hypothetical protein
MIVDHIFIKKDWKEYNFRAIVIWGLHALGAWIASVIVNESHKNWAKYIVWNARPANQTEIYTNIGTLKEPKVVITDSEFEWGVECFEEISGVLSLLIGCIYLLWLSKNEERMRVPIEHDDELPPLMNIQFYLRLTLFVASVSRGFPSAHLSFHVSLYLYCMGSISSDSFGAHFVGGLVGLIITIIFIVVRLYIGWKADEKDKKKNQPNQGQSVDTTEGLGVEHRTLFRQTHYTPLRVSLQGGNYL